MCLDIDTLNTKGMRCDGSSNHLVQVVAHVRLCRPCQSPFKPGSPLLLRMSQLWTRHCSANAEIQVPALRQIRDKCGEVVNVASVCTPGTNHVGHHEYASTEDMPHKSLG